MLTAVLCVQLDDSDGGDGPGLAGMLGEEESPELDDSVEQEAVPDAAEDDDVDVDLDDSMEGGEGDDAATADVEDEATLRAGEGQEDGAEEWYHEGDAGEGEGEEYAEEDGEGEYAEAEAGGEYTEEAHEETAEGGGDEDLAE